jgi:DNA mismatch endonuclease (patch repair protein)
MSRVKGQNTGPELKLRKTLWSLGLRYRLGYKLPGKPDLVFVSAKVAVFVDGCFWHACPLHGKVPQTNQVFWAEKILKNKLRDNHVNMELAKLGWTTIRFWEHEIKKDICTCSNRIIKAIEEKGKHGTPVKAAGSRNSKKKTSGSN